VWRKSFDGRFAEFRNDLFIERCLLEPLDLMSRFLFSAASSTRSTTGATTMLASWR
jgi:hypothetical protein